MVRVDVIRAKRAYKRFEPEFATASDRRKMIRRTILCTGVTVDRVGRVKYREDLRANWRHLRPAFAIARTWTREHQARFRYTEVAFDARCF